MQQQGFLTQVISLKGKLLKAAAILLIVLTVPICFLCKPLYYRLYFGDRIKGNIRVIADGNNIFLDKSSFTGCDNVREGTDSTYVSRKAGEYGGYNIGFEISAGENIYPVTLSFYQYNWWNVTEFDLTAEIDTENKTAVFECSYFSVEEDGSKRYGSETESVKLPPDDEIVIRIG